MTTATKAHPILTAETAASMSRAELLATLAALASALGTIAQGLVALER